MLSVKDLKPQTIDFQVTMNYQRLIDPITNKARIDGRTERVVLQLLSVHEWEEIGFMIDDPVPPLDVKTGKPDYTSMRSITERNRAEYKRNILRLAHALAKGGSFQFEGETLEEQAEELADMDMGIFNAWFAQLQNATNQFEIRVSTSAERFPSGNGKRRIPESEVTNYATTSEPVPDMG